LVNGDKKAAAVKAVETRANFMMVQEAKVCPQKQAMIRFCKREKVV
jgi:hypothetical protein